MKLHRLAGFLFAITVSSTGFAQDEEGFSGRVALGYLATTGNTENKSINTDFNLWWNYEPWLHALTGQFIRAETEGIDTANSDSLRWKSDYNFSETSYAFGLFAWNEDEFSSYSRQLRLSGGYGRRIINNERHTLNGEIGAGYRDATLIDNTSQDEGILILRADYRFIISETSEFSQTLQIDSGSSNTYTEAQSRLTATIFNDLALVLSYTIKRNSDVVPGTVRTDTFTALSLEYAF